MFDTIAKAAHWYVIYCFQIGVCTLPRIQRDGLDLHIGGRLREIRVRAGRNQQELGQQLGISFQQIQKYESGTNRISASVLFRLAQIFDVPPSYFYEGISAAMTNIPPAVQLERNDDRVQEFARTAEGTLLLDAYLRLDDPAIRKRVLALIRSMASTPVDETTTVP